MKPAVGMDIFKSSKFVQVKRMVTSILITKRIGFTILYVCVFNGNKTINE